MGRSKTGSEVVGDVMGLLRGSALAGLAGGRVYRAGYRPAGSVAEDIVVAFTAGLAGEVSSGVVTVNAFVPDVPLGDGTLVCDGARCAAYEAAAAAWAAGLTCAASGGYRFRLARAISTARAEGAGQHFVTVRLGYDLFEG